MNCRWSSQDPGAVSSHIAAVSRHWLIAIIAAGALAFAAKFTLAVTTYGSTDIAIWQADLDKLQSAGNVALYRDGVALDRGGLAPLPEEFNHPPFMLRLLSFWSRLAGLSGIPFGFWLRLTCAVADVASALLLAGILIHSRIRFRPEVLFIIVLTPVSILISGFHGNTDPIMMAFVLLCVYLLETRRPYWLAGLALGMAINIKIQPLIYLPALWFVLGSAARRFQFLAGVVALSIIASYPLIFENPLLIWTHVFGYTPQAGVWGLSRFASVLMGDAQLQSYQRIAKIALLGMLALASIWMNVRKNKPPPVLVQCGLLSFLFLAFSPGFGVQYLVWLAPWTAILTTREALAFHATSGIFLFSYYNRAAHGWPWYAATSAITPVWYGKVVFLGLLCWIIICLSAVSIARKGSRMLSKWSVE